MGVCAIYANLFKANANVYKNLWKGSYVGMNFEPETYLDKINTITSINLNMVST